MSNDEQATTGKESDLQTTAEQGAMPYAAEENEAADRGEDASPTAETEEKTDEAERGATVGGVNMH